MLPIGTDPCTVCGCPMTDQPEDPPVKKTGATRTTKAPRARRPSTSIAGLTDTQLKWVSEGFWQMGVLSAIYKRDSTEGEALIEFGVKPYFENMSNHDDSLISALGRSLPEHPSFAAAMERIFERYNRFDSTDEFMETPDGEQFREGLQQVLDSLDLGTKDALLYKMAMLEESIKNLP